MQGFFGFFFVFGGEFVVGFGFVFEFGCLGYCFGDFVVGVGVGVVYILQGLIDNFGRVFGFGNYVIDIGVEQMGQMIKNRYGGVFL